MAAPDCPSIAQVFAVVIPAYGEAATIGEIVAGCRGAADIGAVIVVDDGSRDATAARAAAAGARVVGNPVNLGKGASLARGLALAMAGKVAGVITLDGDGQHRPADLVRLIARARARPGTIVIGSRRAASGAPLSRYAANRVADFLISWAAGRAVDDSQSGFRLYPASVLRRLQLGAGLAGGFSFESEILIAAAWLGIGTESVEIPAIYGPTLRRSHFRPLADIGRIGATIGLRLLRRGFYPAGLWRALRRSRR